MFKTVFISFHPTSTNSYLYCVSAFDMSDEKEDGTTDDQKCESEKENCNGCPRTGRSLVRSSFKLFQ